MSFKIAFKFRRIALAAVAGASCFNAAFAESEAPLEAKARPVPEVKDAAGVKNYLVSTVTAMNEAAGKFDKLAEAYEKIIAGAGGDYAKAQAAHKDELHDLVHSMRELYKQMDSFGYETVEGIVAGVDALAQFDVDMDAGVPLSEGPDDVAQITLTLSDGKVIEKEGALFTYIIEPALWGGDPRWIKPLDLDGDGEVKFRESLPRAEVLTAAAAEAKKRIAQLLVDSRSWEPTKADFFGAMTLMTPTLSEYFEDWKESRYSEETSGRFFAVSRVSDMRGIMQSCAVMFNAVEGEVAAKDKSLATSVTTGFEEIFTFLDKISVREAKGDLSIAEIDELASQAKDRTDKLVPQIEQAQALTQGS